MSEDFQPPRAFFEFRIVRPLGRGAMGEVFLADDELLGRQVAIKFVRHAERPEMRARFLLEARSLARLQHPNVVAVHRVGEVLGRPFIVSEWVDGRSLDLLPLPLDPDLVLSVALQLARALAAAHRAGVLHRDLKPANVLLSDAGELKLVDFGVSAALAEPDDLPARKADPGLAETQPLPGAADPVARHGAMLQVGTPLYAAPELLGGAPGTRLSDLYAWGAVIYEICSGRPPYQAQTLDDLRAQAEAGAFAPLARAPKEVAALVQACLSPDPRGRPQRAEALLEILEPLAAQKRGPLPEEPYRGLSVFGPEHAALFFGREREVRAVLERLRAASFVLVAGDSGVGKSSLCRAGVLPQLRAGALEQRRFEVISLSLGMRPVEAVASALRPWLGVDEPAGALALRTDPEQLAARARAAPAGEGRALFVDGLEELVSLASPDDAEALSRFLGALTVRSPGFRFLSTARSDFLTRLSALPALGPELGAALYLLRPLTEEGLRQAIEGPARAADFRFVPETLVDDLVAAARVGPGALPLVQFAVTELWQRRDPVRRVIDGSALLALGGVGGALARHADEAIAQLPPPQRRAAEQILRLLVTAQGTRARRTRADFPPGADVSGALEALVAARILTSGDPQGSVAGGSAAATYELAHEALIQSWEQLRAWVGQDEQKRALLQRLERAAEEWESSRGEGLWSRRRLRDLQQFTELPLGERERRFVLASRSAARKQRLLLVAGAVAVPLLLALGIVEVRARAQAAQHKLAAAQLEGAAAALERARALDKDERPLRREAFARFDADQTVVAEQVWTRVLAADRSLAQALEQARGAIDSALLLSPGEEPRRLLADLVVFRLERDGQNPLSRDRAGLLAQLAQVDPGGARRAPFERPARLKIDVEAQLRPLLDASPALKLQPFAERELKPGSYVLELAGGGRLPLLLRYGDRQELKLRGARPAPPGFIALPAGRYFTGYEGEEDVRLGIFGAPPLHERESAAFAIARTEVTFAQWLEYLRALPPQERKLRLPAVQTARNGVALSQRGDGLFVLRIQPTTQAYEAVEGAPLVYPGRRTNAAVDWGQLPVTGISFQDASAYAAWLSSQGKVPHARLCHEEEWERAARGADGRAFPSGDNLSGAEANIDETYGREPLAFGPDPVGSHPRSDSPVGASDMAGNAWELVVSPSGAPAIRGGSWYQGALSARAVNREPSEATARGLLIGLRLCADPQ